MEGEWKERYSPISEWCEVRIDVMNVGDPDEMSGLTQRKRERKRRVVFSKFRFRIVLSLFCFRILWDVVVVVWWSELLLLC